MNCYLCVYRQPITTGWDKTWKEASSEDNHVLKKYLQRYKKRLKKPKEGIGRFYDWGDDPAFFGAEEFLGDIRKASWGVCRPDVRRNLEEGDVVVFFCAQQQKNTDQWDYYYVGLGTVGEVVCNRSQIWKKKRYRDYSKFYNLLIDSTGSHREVIRRWHNNWEKLLKSHYVIFEASDKTHFNVTNPLHVATYTEGETAWKGEILERWCLSDKRVTKVYDLVPKRDGGKKLRTSPTWNSHRHMNLSNLCDTQLEEMRQEFLEISREIAEQ